MKQLNNHQINQPLTTKRSVRSTPEKGIEKEMALGPMQKTS